MFYILTLGMGSGFCLVMVFQSVSGEDEEEELSVGVERKTATNGYEQKFKIIKGGSRGLP